MRVEKFDARGCYISFHIAMSIIDEAIQSGNDRRLLRWRVSHAQGLAIFMCAISIAVNPSPVTASLDAGAAYESGMFCGIPYAVDRSLNPTEFYLERLTPEPIAEIVSLGVPQDYRS